MRDPQRPQQIPEFAQACLFALADAGLGQFLSLGGAFGLAHYLEYRATHDVDAWWMEPISREHQREVVSTLERALRPFGPVRTRWWGDVVSVELEREQKVVFGFQIAHRSALLAPPIAGLWPGGLLLDRFDDLIASKMVALVERGAPRDLRDIFTVCQNGLISAQACWKLWRSRQQLAGENADPERAETAVLSHLARLEQARPLEAITNVEQRAAADQVRRWFRAEFLHGLSR